MTDNIHAVERVLIIEGFRQCYGHEPSLSVAQCLQAIDWLETSYGRGWSSKIPGAAESRNRGAITAGGSWQGRTFEHKDSYPDAAGVNHWYTTKFRAYDTDQEAVTDLCNIVYLTRDPAILRAAELGSTLSFSTALYYSHYYAGFGKTPDERIARHHAAVQSSIALQCKALGEPMPYPVTQGDLDAIAAQDDDRRKATNRYEQWVAEFTANNADA